MSGSITVSIKTMETLLSELATKKQKSPKMSTTKQKKKKKKKTSKKPHSPKAKKEVSKTKVAGGGVTKKKRAPKDPNAPKTSRKKKTTLGASFTPAQVAALVETMPQMIAASAGISSPTVIVKKQA